MSVIYTHLTYEEYKTLEQQMKRFAETSHRTEGGFYHKSIRLRVKDDLIIEFHGPMVGGYGHLPEPTPARYPIPGRVAGGIARAAALTQERRTEIARDAAKTRWSRKFRVDD